MYGHESHTLLLFLFFLFASLLHALPLEVCLGQSIQRVDFQGDPEFEESRHCINRRPDIAPNPLAIVHAERVEDVQAAIRCASLAGVPVCARGGRHGFDNDAGCTGGVAVNLAGLQFFSFNATSNVTEFGSGHCLGQLYYKLAQEPRQKNIPAGTVNGVGVGGLILGCGRGLTTQTNGLACDSIKSVEYVDSAGEVQVANEHLHDEMLWMAKGGGGNFPGIVTKFTMETYDMPHEVYSLVCTFPSHDAKPAIKAWLARGEELEHPSRKLATSLQMWNRPAIVEIFMNCLDCNSSDKQWQHETMDAITADTSSTQCHTVSRTWLEYILYESGYEHGMVHVPSGQPKESGLLDCSNGWGNQGPMTASKNGGHMGYEWNISDELLDKVLYWTHTNTPDQDYGLMIEWYPTGGPKVQDIPRASAAYGPRGTKWVLHYKHQWPDSHGIEKMNEMLQHHVSMSEAIDGHLPCTNFYNYMDKDMPCAATQDRWLEAHFSDVPRMYVVKAAADPNHVFWSRLETANRSFEPVDGGDNRACRGAHVGDNLGAHYMVLSDVPSLADCKWHCQNAVTCVGVEYAGTRCELWSRPDGIGASAFVPNHTCLRHTSSFLPLDGGVGRACRGSSSGDNSPGHYMVLRGVASLAACKRTCALTSTCKGIEYSPGRCELWTRAAGIEATVPLAGYICLGFLPRSAMVDSVDLELFTPIDGGTGRACRGQDVGDNNPANYIRYDADSISACKELCKESDICVGIEYSRGRCEVWTRAEGINATVAFAGFECLRFQQESRQLQDILTSSSFAQRPLAFIGVLVGLNMLHALTHLWGASII